MQYRMHPYPISDIILNECVCVFAQIFPGNRELLYLVSEKDWMKLLLGWMNQYDRPKVQVEAMLSLTTITDLCQQQFYQNPPTGVEVSPFSTGLETIHNPFKRPGSGSVTGTGAGAGAGGAPKEIPKVLKNANANANAPGGKPGSIAERVKNIMNQAKETSNVNTILVIDSTESSKLGGSAMGQQAFVATNTSMVNSLLTQAISESTGNVASPTKIPPKDSYLYRSGICARPDDESSDDKEKEKEKEDENHLILGELQYRNGVPIEEWSKKHNSQTSPLPKPAAPEGAPMTLATATKLALEQERNAHALANAKEGNGDTNPNEPPGLSPAILSALNSSFQNLPMPSGAGSSSIPLVGNYTQPLSVTSNNLLVRHPEAIPSFISLMTSPDKDVCENAMWVVGNIAAGEGAGVPRINPGGSNASGLGDMGDKSPNVTVKDIVLAAGAMGPLLRCMERFTDALSLQRVGAWVISTLVETKLPPGKKSTTTGTTTNTNENSRIEDIDLEQLLNTLRRLIQTNDDDILSYICWSLSHLCDGPASNIAAVVTSPDPKDVPGGLVPRLVELLHYTNWRVTKPALRTIGNIVCAEYDEDVSNAIDGDKPANALTDFTEVILECDAVPRLKLLINHGNREIQKEACWTLSNIAAGTVDQIQAVIDSGAIPPLVQLVNNDSTDQEVRSEACWVVLNATSCGSDQQIGVLVSEGCVSVLGLLIDEPNMVTMALEGLERVLQVEEAREAAWSENQRLGGASNKNSSAPSPLVSASLIEKALTKNYKSTVTKRAQKIWKEHFVSCALCNQSYSKHRVSDAKFCEECKCHVCHNCNCEVYHLSYQEELWADSEEKKGGKSKKKKNKKKKEKRKEKRKVQEVKVSITPTPTGGAQSTTNTKHENKEKAGAISDSVATSNTKTKELPTEKETDTKPGSPASSVVSEDDDEMKDLDEEKKPRNRSIPAIDFNLYLQETGSIIAVSRLMDALDQLHKYT